MKLLTNPRKTRLNQRAHILRARIKMSIIKKDGRPASAPVAMGVWSQIGCNDDMSICVIRNQLLAVTVTCRYASPKLWTCKHWLLHEVPQQWFREILWICLRQGGVANYREVGLRKINLRSQMCICFKTPEVCPISLSCAISQSQSRQANGLDNSVVLCFLLLIGIKR